MTEMDAALEEFRVSLGRRQIQLAYRQILAIFGELASQAKASNRAGLAAGALYHGYLDMSYLPITTPALKSRGLKVALVFDYERFGFFLWLSAVNKQVQRQMWELARAEQWRPAETLGSLEGQDALLEKSLNRLPPLSETAKVTAALWIHVDALIADAEAFIARNP